MNKVWRAMGATMADVNSVTRGKVIASSRAGWCCVNNFLYLEYD